VACADDPDGYVRGEDAAAHGTSLTFLEQALVQTGTIDVGHPIIHIANSGGRLYVVPAGVTTGSVLSIEFPLLPGRQNPRITHNVFTAPPLRQFYITPATAALGSAAGAVHLFGIDAALMRDHGTGGPGAVFADENLTFWSWTPQRVLASAGQLVGLLAGAVEQKDWLTTEAGVQVTRVHDLGYSGFVAASTDGPGSLDRTTPGGWLREIELPHLVYNGLSHNAAPRRVRVRTDVSCCSG
jgi:hypothetical protein